MIKNYAKEAFKEALAFSRTLPKESRKSLLNCISSLNKIKRINEFDLVIKNDFVKHSFLFAFGKMNPETETWERKDFNGGIILHGFEETYSIELNPAKYPHWSIHT